MRKKRRRERENRERNVFEPGDVEEGLRAALAIGNDQLQNMSRGSVQPEHRLPESFEQHARARTAEGNSETHTYHFSELNDSFSFFPACSTFSPKELADRFNSLPTFLGVSLSSSFFTTLDTSCSIFVAVCFNAVPT